MRFIAAQRMSPEDRGMAAAERAAEKAGALEARPEREPTALPQGLHAGPTEPTPIDKELSQSAEVKDDAASNDAQDQDKEGGDKDGDGFFSE